MKKFFLILIALVIGCGGYFFYKQTGKPQKQRLHLHRMVKNGIAFKKWISFNPKNENFSASFPKKPKLDSRNLPIPGSDDFLPYKEYRCELDEDILFSVSYTTLPKEWLKYGNSLVLGGALKVIMHEFDKSELVGKETTLFKSFPALDYEHYTVAEEGQKETAGTLVLVGNTLYKIEMNYPLELHENVKDQLAYFIENFTPTQGEVKASQSESSATDTPQSPQ